MTLWKYCRIFEVLKNKKTTIMSRNIIKITDTIESEMFTNGQGEKVIQLAANGRTLDEVFYPEDPKEEHLKSLEFVGITGEEAEIIANKLIELYA